MELHDPQYEAYVRILRRELVPAMGCTEPISIAYAAALAAERLGEVPERAVAAVSGNIIKNAKSVTVPHTGGLKGIAAAVAAGILAGDSRRELQVLSQVDEETERRIRAFADSGRIEIRLADTERVFDIDVTVYAGAHEARARITDGHTHVALLSHDGVAELDRQDEVQETDQADRLLLNVNDIITFAEICALPELSPLLRRQIALNTAIAEAGLRGDWGANIGRTILRNAAADDVAARAKARAAAGSDARMSGCELPVVINSGSGNQGIAVSVPVIEYARSLRASEEQLMRALVLANLLAVHQKTNLGKLSAFCGAVNAGCAAGAAIAYLHGGGQWLIHHTMVNCLAITSGLVCDGAKPSCAAKVALAVEGGILGYQMAREKRQFFAGEGIVKKGVENTIASMNRLGRDGMRQTDVEILHIMLCD